MAFSLMEDELFSSSNQKTQPLSATDFNSAIPSDVKTTEDLTKLASTVMITMMPQKLSNGSNREHFEVVGPKNMKLFKALGFSTQIDTFSTDPISTIVRNALLYVHFFLSKDDASTNGLDVVLGAALSARSLEMLVNSARGNSYANTRYVLIKDADTEWLNRMDRSEHADVYKHADPKITGFRKLITLSMLKSLGFVENTAKFQLSFEIESKYASLEEAITWASIKEGTTQFASDLQTAFDQTGSWVGSRGTLATTEVAARFTTLQNKLISRVNYINRVSTLHADYSRAATILASFIRHQAIGTIRPIFETIFPKEVEEILSVAVMYKDLVAMAYDENLAVLLFTLDDLRFAKKIFDQLETTIADRFATATIEEVLRHVNVEITKHDYAGLYSVVLSNKFRVAEHPEFVLNADDTGTTYLPLTGTIWTDLKTLQESISSELVLNVSRDILNYAIFELNSHGTLEIFADLRVDSIGGESDISLLGYIAADSYKALEDGSGKLYYTVTPRVSAQETAEIIASYGFLGTNIRIDSGNVGNPNRIMTDSWQLVLELSNYKHNSDIIEISSEVLSQTAASQALTGERTANIVPAQGLQEALRMPIGLELSTETAKLSVLDTTFPESANVKFITPDAKFFLSNKVRFNYDEAGHICDGILRLFQLGNKDLKSIRRMEEYLSQSSVHGLSFSNQLNSFLKIIVDLPHTNDRFGAAWATLCMKYPNTLSTLSTEVYDANKEAKLAFAWSMFTSYAPDNVLNAILPLFSLLSGFSTSKFMTDYDKMLYSMRRNRYTTK